MKPSNNQHNQFNPNNNLSNNADEKLINTKGIMNILNNNYDMEKPQVSKKQVSNQKNSDDSNAKNLQDTINKTDEKMSAMEKNQIEIDRHYQKQLDKKWTLLEQLSQRGLYKLVKENRQELFNASAEYRIKFYRTILDGRLEALAEKTNAGLMMIKAEYRHQVAVFMMSKLKELAFEVKNRQREFLEMMMEKYDYTQTLESYPLLKNQYVNSIINEGERYMNFLDRLIIRFENIIDEQLKKYK